MSWLFESGGQRYPNPTAMMTEGLCVCVCVCVCVYYVRVGERQVEVHFLSTLPK